MDHSLTLASAEHHLHHAHDHNPEYLDPALAQEDIDAATAEIINASIRTAAQAHAAAAAEAEAAEAVVAEAVAEANAGSQDIDQLYHPDEEVGPPPITTPRTSNIVVPANGSLYPFAAPQRDDSTPHPLDESFATRADFDVWLAAESSWCHYVQRRVTNPEKRAEERAKSRDKAHEKRLAEMDPEDAAREPPLKKRHRTRTSAVVHKITYTCHHAGKYEPQHNTDLPQERLRMNTKTSVKCGCMSRIVMNEMADGEIKVAYWWKHNGHDPFAEKEAETYRLPQSVTDWLLAQFQKGKQPEDIIKLLNVPEEVKLERIRRAAAAISAPTPTLPLDDPTNADGDPDALTAAVHGGEADVLAGMDEDDLPPVIAYGLQIKYPDLYNRYRKVGPPLRSRKSELGDLKGRGSVEPKAKGGAAKKGRKRKVEVEEGGEEDEGEQGGVRKPAMVKTGTRGGKRQKGKGKDVVGAEETEVDGEIAMPDAGVATDVGEPTSNSADQGQIYLVNDDFTFDDLVTDNLPHYDPPPPATSSTSALPNSSTFSGTDSALADHDEAKSSVDLFRAAAAALPSTAGVGLGDGAGEVGHGHPGEEDGGELMDEEETTRMTEELEKLANEITSTWRH